MCQVFFISRQALKKHGICSGTKKTKNRFTCPKCPYTTNIKTNFKNHSLTHGTERPFTCPECGMGFIQKINMFNHLTQHSKEKNYDLYLQKLNCWLLYVDRLKIAQLGKWLGIFRSVLVYCGCKYLVIVCFLFTL